MVGLSPPPDLAATRRGGVRRRRRLVLLITSALLAAAVLFGGGWVLGHHTPPAAQSPHEAIGRLEGALRRSDAGAVARLMRSETAVDGNPADRAQRLVARHGHPELRFARVVLSPTESGSFYVVRIAAITGSGEATELQIGVQDVMNLDTGGSAGWFISA